MNLTIADVAGISGIVGAILVFAGFIIKLMVKNMLLENRLKLLDDFKDEYLTVQRYEQEKKNV